VTELLKMTRDRLASTVAWATKDSVTEQVSMDYGMVLLCHSTRSGTEKSDG
jgi:hypothetical protein